MLVVLCLLVSVSCTFADGDMFNSCLSLVSFYFAMSSELFGDLVHY